MKRIAEYLTLVLVLVVLFFGSRYLRIRIVRAQSSLPPFTAIMHEYLLPDGPERPSLLNVRTIAVRSDGAVSAGLLNVRHNRSTEVLRTVQFPDSQYMIMSPTVKTISRGHRKQSDLQNELFSAQVPPGCVYSREDQVVGTERLSGRTTFKIVTEIAGPVDGQKYRVTRWRDSSLGCFVLKRTFEELLGARVTLQSELVLTNLLFGEPDRALFADPAGYEEVVPSETLKRALATHGGIFEDPTGKWARFDRDYLESRSER